MILDLKMNNDNKKIFISYYLLNFFYCVHYWFIMIQFPPYAKNAGLSDVQIGTILSLYNIISLIFMLPFGIITDRLGARNIIMTASVLILSWLGIVAFYTSFKMLIIAFILGGIGTVLFLISLNAAFYSMLDFDKAQKKVTFFYIAATLGFMFGPFIGSNLLQFIGYSNTFKADMIIICIMMIIILNVSWPKNVEFNIFDYLKDFNKKSFILILLTFVFYSHYGTEQTSYTLYMKDNVKLTDFQIGNVFIILGFWVSLVTLLTGKLSNTKYMILIYGSAVLISGFFQFFTGYFKTFETFIVMRLLHTCGDAVCSLMLGILVTIVFNKNRLGFSFGFFLFAQLIASIPFTYVSKALSKTNDYSLPFYFNGAFMSFCAILILLYRKKLRRILGMDK